MSFDALMGNVSRDEMKTVLAGSGYTQSQIGGGGGYIVANAMSIGYQTVASFYPGMQSTNIPGSAMYVPQQSYNSSNGWGMVAEANQYNYNNNYNTNYNNNYSIATNNSSSNSLGWVATTNGNIKTTDPTAISRLMGLVDSNILNNRSPGYGLNDFVQNETTASGRAINDTIYGAIALNNVTVYNNYRRPEGMNYQNGSLYLDMGVMMGSHGVIMGSGSNYQIQTLTIANQQSTSNDDYVFSDNGSLIGMKDAGNGRNIKVSINGKLYNLSDLNTSPLLQGSGTASTITKIVTYLAVKAGIPIGFVGIANNTDPSTSTLAFTRSDRTVYLNSNGGISKLLDNFDNLISVLKHEHLHQIELDKKATNTNYKTDFETHVNVYLKQCSDSTFANTTADFKLGQVASLTNYLMNMDRNDPDNLYDRNTIVNKIKEFNDLKNGYQITNDTNLGWNPAELHLSVTKGNDAHYESTYTPVIN